MVRRSLGRWRVLSSEVQYLSAATDHADLERRMRVLERESGGPVYVTFNHWSPGTTISRQPAAQEALDQ